MIAHNSPISGVACHGGLVATAAYDGQVVLWDAARKRAISRARHDHLANHCSFSRCGRYLVSASSDYSARVWRVPELALLTIMNHDDDVERAVFDASGDRIATASCDKKVRVFDRDGRLLHRFEGHSTDQMWADFSVHRNQLISASDDGDIRWWNLETGSLVRQHKLERRQVDAFAEGPDGLLYAGDDAGALLAIGSSGLLWEMEGHQAGIKCLSYDPEARRLLSTSYDGFLRGWRVGAGGRLAPEFESKGPPLFWPRSCATSEGDRVVVGTFGASYAAFDLPTLRWNFDRVERTHGLNWVTFSQGHSWTAADSGIVRRDGEIVADLGELLNFVVPAGPTAIAGGQSGRILDVNTGALVYQHDSPVNFPLFVPGDRPRLLIGTYSGELLVFHVEPSGLSLASRVPISASAIKSLATDGQTILAVGTDLSLSFLAADTLAVERVIRDAHGLVINNVVAIGSGVYATVSRDRVLKIWGKDGAKAVETPHTHSVRGLAHCPATGRLATGSYDGTLAIFDLRREVWTATERPTTAGISSVCATDRPGVFLASSYDGAVYEFGGDDLATPSSR